MTKRTTLRFFLKTALGGISFLVSLMSIAMPNWIERIFYVEPDAGLGWTEWGWAISLGAAAVVFFADAYRLRSRRNEGASA